MLKKILFPFLVLTAISFVNTSAQFDQNKEVVKIKLESSQKKAARNSLLKVALKVSIEKGWHINSNKPHEDFLISTKVVSTDKRFPLANVEYPNAQDITLGFSDQPVSVFEGDIVINLLINIEKELSPGSYKRFRFVRSYRYG